MRWSLVLSALLLLGGFAISPGVFAQQSAAPKPPSDVERLKAEYGQKQQSSMLPVIARYQADLAKLAKRLADSGNLDGAASVKSELDALQDTSGKEWKRDPKEPAELSRLRQECSQRAQEAMRPVDAKYRADFEFLARKLTQKSDLEGASAAKQAADSIITGEPSPEQVAELKRAILGNTWSWKNNRKDHGVEMTFHKDGAVTHRGMKAKWKITGARDVSISISNGDTMVLRFDTELKSYQAIAREFHGEIWTK